MFRENQPHSGDRIPFWHFMVRIEAFSKQQQTGAGLNCLRQPAVWFLLPFSPERNPLEPVQPTPRNIAHKLRQAAEREDLRPWFLTLDDLSAPLNWPEFFENSQPVQLDIGCGRGLFLFNASAACPENNYLGLEIDYKEGRRGAKRLKKEERPNARVLGCDANKALTEFIPAESVAAVHVYFPDPWWKARHHKRRLFTEDFTRLIFRVLQPGGELHGWTDVFDYWELMTGHIRDHGGFQEVEAPSERPAEHHMDYQTSFERKKRLAGWPIYRGRWIKQGNESGS